MGANGRRYGKNDRRCECWMMETQAAIDLTACLNTSRFTECLLNCDVKSSCMHTVRHSGANDAIVNLELKAIY